MTEPTETPNRRWRAPLAVALLAVMALLGAACGDQAAGPPVPETPAESAFPVDVQGANGTVTIESRPNRIVSLAPSLTEMLFAIGAGDQVVAVDDQSNFPPEAPTTDLSGFTPNLEAIAAQEPDLVVVSNDIEDLVDGLAGLDIPVLLLEAPTDLSGTYEQIETLGAATGHTADAEELVSSMKEEITELSGRVPEPEEPLTYYHELDPTLFSVTSATFIGNVYGLAGLRNIADAAPDDAGGYPQLSAEFIIDADPDYIFLAHTTSGEAGEAVAQRPGWSQMTAVKEGNVVVVDADIASRWGPRVVDFLRAVVDAVGAPTADAKDAA
ncbi:MAG: ABC transporter substrate-binding protein [Actinobacteria bacterium]|nr:ABC transporter substrate-binding protein [Actinomycetota bacterium]